MKKLVALILAVLTLLGSLGLMACTSRSEILKVYNWEDYIDPAVIEMFEEETGITVNYMCFTTVEDMIV